MNPLEELVAAIRKNNDLLKDCQAIVSARARRDTPKTLRRGVRMLEHVPDYLCRQTLAHLTQLDESMFTNQSNTTNYTLLIWALGGDPKHKVISVGSN